MQVIDAMIDQVSYIRSAVGIDYVCISLDGDGFTGLPYKDYADVHAAIRQRMKARGFSDEEIDKVLCGNYLHAVARRDELVAADRKAEMVAQKNAIATRTVVLER
jgi:microsomal dipeptidase-like Zn-dependent dipeptidase